MKFRLAVVLGILFIGSISAHVHAQTESQSASAVNASTDPAKIAAIHRLLEVMDIANVVSRITPAAFQQMDSIRDSLSEAGESTNAPSRISKRQQLFREIVLAKFQAVDLVELMVPIYDKNFTLDDINALTVFYQSPAGRKILRLGPQIDMEMKQALAPILVKIMRETDDQIKKEHPELDYTLGSAPGFGGVIGGVPAGVAPPPPPPPSGSRPMRVTKGGDVAAATATNKVAPIYPELAIQTRVEGTVRLRTLIDTDGQVIEVTIVSGPPMLVQAAIDSVKQWRFRPTILQGVPVQVECVLEVNFHLAK